MYVCVGLDRQIKIYILLILSLLRLLIHQLNFLTAEQFPHFIQQLCNSSIIYSVMPTIHWVLQDHTSHTEMCSGITHRTCRSIDPKCSRSLFLPCPKIMLISWFINHTLSSNTIETQADKMPEHVQECSQSTVEAAAAAAESRQSCPTLCGPIDSSPPGSTIPGILQARTLVWVIISFSNEWKWKVKVKSLSRGRLFTTPWTAAYQAPPSTGFSRQEYWNGSPLPSPTTKAHQF